MNLSEINRLRKHFQYIRRMGANFRICQVFFRSRTSQKKLKKQALKREAAFQEFIRTRSFSNEWFAKNLYIWNFILSKIEPEKVKKIVEIGSWEGMSTNFLALAFPGASIACVDTWAGADEHVSGDAASAETLKAIERTFDQNTLDFANQITKFKMRSFDFFASRKPEDQFDLIYIDGSHDAEDVIFDAFLSFGALKPGGFLIFDDYLWKYYGEERKNPASAINYFLAYNAAKIDLVFVDSQVVLQKL